MKKSLVGIIAIVLIFALVITGIIMFSNSDKTTNSSDSQLSGTSSSSNTETSKPSKSKYDSDLLRKVSDLQNINGKIIDIANSGSDLYLATNNKIYGGYDYNEILSSKENIKRISFIADDTSILQNSDNTYTTYCENYEQIGAEPVMKAIENINLDNAIFAFKSLNNNTYIIIKKESNVYFVDKYTLDSAGKVDNEFLKQPLYLNLGGKVPEKLEKNIKQIYIDSNYHLIFVLSDGRVFDTGVTISFMDKEGYITIVTNTTTEILNNVEEVYAYGSSMEYRRPLFEKIDDKNNLYTYSAEAPMTTRGTPADEYKIMISMPSGYTTDDIKNVVLYEDLLIEFNDGSIYVSKKDELNKLVLEETITDYRKKGKIKKFGLMGSNMVVLMDDKCVYEIDM